MPTAKAMSFSAVRQRGFTLLELLISSIIFAIMAIMAYGGLSNVMDNSQASERALKRLQQVQQTVSVISRDFLQLMPRSVRDEYGNLQPAISTTNNIDHLVEFTRGGRSNPANLLRSTLVRVAYQFDDEKLLRLQWPQLDNAPGVVVRETTLIDNLENVTVRFLDEKGVWREQWPPLNAVTNVDGGNTAELFAIEIILQLNDWGDIRRLYAMK